jgi:hypothetical protein
MTLDEFMTQLDEDPSTFGLRLAIADWPRERGDDELAHGFEWAASPLAQPFGCPSGETGSGQAPGDGMPGAKGLTQCHRFDPSGLARW